MPNIRKWLSEPVDLLVELFTGGGIVSLTAVMERLAKRAVMVELDRDVAAFWRAALERPVELAVRVSAFSPTRAHVEWLARHVSRTVLDHGFRTLVLNRTRTGGVLAAGAALVRGGENGTGVRSRWYPDTLVRRREDMAECAERLLFLEGNGVRLAEAMCRRPGVVFFVDPPFTAPGGKRAGSRLYGHSSVDHARIFKVLADCQADFLMTYDCSSDIVGLVRRHGFHAATVEMKSGHHLRIPELLITRRRVFT